jgi:hypothetical protein
MKTTRKKTCGRGQGCTKILSPVKVQEFYQPSNSKDQKIIEDRLMRSVAAAQRRIDFEKEKAKASRHVSFKIIFPNLPWKHFLCNTLYPSWNTQS